MRWEDFRRSDNVEYDNSGGGGGGGGFPVGGGGLGIGTVVVLGLVGWALGIDPRILIGGAEIVMGGGDNRSQYEQPYRPPRGQEPAQRDATSNPAGPFVEAVLGNTEDVWGDIFREGGQRYQPPRLLVFNGSTNSRCGFAQAAMGPFYCPSDRRIYLDTSFFNEIEQRFRGCSGKACKFAQAYVIAHEVGHHVQNVLGVLRRAEEAKQQAGSRAAANRIQVQVELQADCFGGVWANRSEQRKSFLDPGDIDAALQTATAIGDDTLQKRSQGRVVPDSFTHGSAEQRKRWFSIGFQQGKVSACDTFRAATL